MLQRGEQGRKGRKTQRSPAFPFLLATTLYFLFNLHFISYCPCSYLCILHRCFCDLLIPVQVGLSTTYKLNLCNRTYSSTDSLLFDSKLIFNVQFKVSLPSVLRQVANDLQMNSEIRQGTDQ